MLQISIMPLIWKPPPTGMASLPDESSNWIQYAKTAFTLNFHLYLCISVWCSDLSIVTANRLMVDTYLSDVLRPDMFRHHYFIVSLLICESVIFWLIILNWIRSLFVLRSRDSEYKLKYAPWVHLWMWQCVGGLAWDVIRWWLFDIHTNTCKRSNPPKG